MKDLEVAHIFPHALMSLNKGEQMMVRTILNAHL